MNKSLMKAESELTSSGKSKLTLYSLSEVRENV